MTRLIICEKNNAAQRISSILSRGNYKKSYLNKVPVYNFDYGGRNTSVVGLRGHILSLDYPAEFAKWSIGNLEKLVMSEPIKKPTATYIANALKTLGRDATEIIIATDFDREGELIGAEAVEIIVPSKIPIKRAKFSALTGPEVNHAFENLVDLNINLARAAETRQVIDLAWGATLTRFVSITTGQTGRDFISVGRVQSPTLALIVDREKEIIDFRPEPFWEISADLVKGKHFMARHTNGKYWERDEAERIFTKVRGAKTARVTSVEKEEKKEYPPSPFDTTQFLSEANRMGISPSKAMSIAESLYTEGWISYPRTDNTVYPKSLPIKRILGELEKSDLGDLAKAILAQDKIWPSKGKKETTDHPPIHPTQGATRQKLKGDNWKIYELVVRRFIATLAPSAVAEATNVIFDINGEPFVSKGYVMLDMGWYKYYPYYKPKQTNVPGLENGEEIPVDKVRTREGETKPPKRFSQGALIREMEKLGLGTKSTRHEIIQKLYERRYIEGSEISPTTTGMALIEALEESAEKITRPDMTRILEKDMEKVAEGEKTMEFVVNESRQFLSDSLETLRKNRDKVRKGIQDALKKQGTLGDCPKCGSSLVVRWSRNKKRFVGCSGYPDCTQTYPLPQSGLIIPHDEACDRCGTPAITLAQKKKKPAKLCLDMSCQQKANGQKRDIEK